MNLEDDIKLGIKAVKLARQGKQTEAELYESQIDSCLINNLNFWDICHSIVDFQENEYDD